MQESPNTTPSGPSSGNPTNSPLSTSECDRWEPGGLDRHPINVLRLISELEGSYQLLKYMGYEEDRDTLRSICDRYYKEYYRLKKLPHEPI